MLRTLYNALPLPLSFKLYLRHFFLRTTSYNAYRKQKNRSRKAAHQFRNLQADAKKGSKLRSILVMDSIVPKPHEDAGSLRTYHMMKMLVASGAQVTFLPVDHMSPDFASRKRLAAIGVTCLCAPEVIRVRPYLKKHLASFDIVFLERVTIAALYVHFIRRLEPHKPIIFDTHDLHYVRYKRQAEIEHASRLRKTAQQMKAIELGVMQRADHTLVVSAYEQELLEQEQPNVPTTLLPLFIEPDPLPASFDQRQGLLFIGGFRHAPNKDAVLHFVNDVWPRVREKLPDAVFHIIGGPVPDDVQALASDHVRVEGFVKNLVPLFGSVRMSVSPLRFGAGVKGKTGTSLAYGLPTVISPITIEGSGLVSEKDVLMAKDADEFAAQIIRLYHDEALWNRLRANGLTFIEENYTLHVNQERLNNVLDMVAPR